MQPVSNLSSDISRRLSIQDTIDIVIRFFDVYRITR